jgi:hypothetical protein
VKFGRTTSTPNTVDDHTWKRVQSADVEKSLDTKADEKRTENYRRNHANPRNS